MVNARVIDVRKQKQIWSVELTLFPLWLDEIWQAVKFQEQVFPRRKQSEDKYQRGRGLLRGNCPVI